MSAESFTYLGLKVTKTYYSLFKSNLTHLLEQCKEGIKRWFILLLSLIRRTNSVKMNIVPKFLYLFQALPVFIPQSFFKAYNQMISSFIWNNKSACKRKEFMERPKEVGGISLPNLHTYYWAANFNAISPWLKELNDRIPAWLQIEKATSSPHSLPALLCAPLPPLVNNIKDNIIVTQSLRIINQFKRCLGDFRCGSELRGCVLTCSTTLWTKSFTYIVLELVKYLYFIRQG